MDLGLDSDPPAPEPTDVEPVITVDVDLAPDLLPQLHLALTKGDRWRRRALTYAAVCAVLLILSGVQMVGTYLSGRQLHESMHKVEQVNKQTAGQLEELKALRDVIQIQAERAQKAERDARIHFDHTIANTEWMRQRNADADVRARTLESELALAERVLREYKELRSKRDRLERLIRDPEVLQPLPGHEPDQKHCPTGLRWFPLTDDEE